jgi:citrate lyase subunit beta/citryl-CoA lyase
MTPLVALYVPGSRPDRFDKAAATGAAVILDLEDAVAPQDRPAARDHVAAWLAARSAARSADRSADERAGLGAVQVRVNAPGSPDLDADLAALPAGVELRVPKVERPEDLDRFAGRALHVLVETALGVENLFAIASVPGVRSVALGEADLAAELGLAGEEAFGWVRSRLVVAARAAGLPAPMMAAYPDLRDLAGLAESCARGRRLGLRGRTAVHPAQVAVIRSVFEPREDEVTWAREVLDVLGSDGVGVLADGSMVDAAMVRRARAILGA